MANNASAYTIEQLRDLESAIAEGARRVKYTDKEIEYRSLTEMKQIARDIRAALGLNANTKKNRNGLFGGRRIIGRHSKGLDE